MFWDTEHANSTDRLELVFLDHSTVDCRGISQKSFIIILHETMVPLRNISYCSCKKPYWVNRKWKWGPNILKYSKSKAVRGGMRKWRDVSRGMRVRDKCMRIEMKSERGKDSTSFNMEQNISPLHLKIKPWWSISLLSAFYSLLCKCWSFSPSPCEQTLTDFTAGLSRTDNSLLLHCHAIKALLMGCYCGQDQWPTTQR